MGAIMRTVFFEGDKGVSMATFHWFQRVFGTDRPLYFSLFQRLGHPGNLIILSKDGLTTTIFLSFDNVSGGLHRIQ